MKYLVTPTTGVRAGPPGQAAAGVRSHEVVWCPRVTAQTTALARRPGGPAQSSP